MAWYAYTSRNERYLQIVNELSMCCKRRDHLLKVYTGMYGRVINRIVQLIFAEIEIDIG